MQHEHHKEGFYIVKQGILIYLSLSIDEYIDKYFILLKGHAHIGRAKQVSLNIKDKKDIT